jgi:hypothetical protein
MTFHGDCVKICEDFAPNFGDKKTGFCITTTYRLTIPFSKGNFFRKNNLTLIPQPTLLFSVSLIEDKTKKPPI